MRRRSSLGLTLALTFALCAGTASAHPLDPRDYAFSGSPAALGAAHVYSGSVPIALFEFYAQPAGAVVAQTPRGGQPAPAAGAWVAAMYYPFSGSSYATHFGIPGTITLHPGRGGVITFTFPKLGAVRIELTGSSQSPDTRPQGLTTPGGHHGHRWNITSVLQQGKTAYVGGWIKRAGTRLSLRTLVLSPGGVISWIAEGATGIIATD